ncbi:hypothetical protein NCCP133_16740 [Cytobacillus sp. NCCP-133]|nr:hypothetical protein NCCP133_16740 [Cytobacillus sp. NCCP-133]
MWKVIERKRAEIENKDDLNKEKRVEWLISEYGRKVARLAFTYTKHWHLNIPLCLRGCQYVE